MSGWTTPESGSRYPGARYFPSPIPALESDDLGTLLEQIASVIGLQCEVVRHVLREHLIISARMSCSENTAENLSGLPWASAAGASAVARAMTPLATIERRLKRLRILFLPVVLVGSCTPPWTRHLHYSLH